jgi:hypothetical protein
MILTKEQCLEFMDSAELLEPTDLLKLAAGLSVIISVKTLKFNFRHTFDDVKIQVDIQIRKV